MSDDKRAALALYAAMNVTDGGAQDFRVVDRIMALADEYATEKAMAAHRDCCYLCLRGLSCVHWSYLARLAAPPVAQEDVL